jgi:hypothetical protein
MIRWRVWSNVLFLISKFEAFIWQVIILLFSPWPLILDQKLVHEICAWWFEAAPVWVDLPIYTSAERLLSDTFSCNCELLCAAEWQETKVSLLLHSQLQMRTKLLLLTSMMTQNHQDLWSHIPFLPYTLNLEILTLRCWVGVIWICGDDKFIGAGRVT